MLCPHHVYLISLELFSSSSSSPLKKEKKKVVSAEKKSDISLQINEKLTHKLINNDDSLINLFSLPFRMSIDAHFHVTMDFQSI